MTGEDYEARKDEHRPDWPGYKSDHLPECGYGIELSFDGVIQPAEPCCCDRLRACEARVLSVAGPHNYSRGRKDGYAAGVKAAREAVAAADPYWKVESDDGAVFVMEVAAALAAIDGLTTSGGTTTDGDK